MFEARCLPVGIEVSTHWSHTLYNPNELIEMNGGHPPASMGQFEKLQKQAGEPLAPAADPPKSLPPSSKDLKPKDFAVPTLKELGYHTESSTPYKVSSISDYPKKNQTGGKSILRRQG